MKYPKKAKVCCPRCEGKGYLVMGADVHLTNGGRRTIDMRNKLRKLAKKHNFDEMSLRQIGELAGIPHAQTVSLQIKAINKTGWDKYE